MGEKGRVFRQVNNHAHRRRLWDVPPLLETLGQKGAGACGLPLNYGGSMQ